MNNFLDSFFGHSAGGINVRMYYLDEVFKPGAKVKIRITSGMKLTKVSYCWNNHKKTSIRVLFNRCWLKVRVPEVPGNKPVLKIITEVQFKDGNKKESEHTFYVNSMH